jgi:uncharacterized protein (TIGR04255 family)
MPTFQKVTEALKSIAEELDLPAVLPHQSFTVPFGLAPSTPPMVQPMAGLSYARYAKTGEIFKSIMCEPNSIKFSLRDYDGWNSTISELKDIFGRIIPAYIEESPAIQVISLVYANSFRANDPEEVVFNEIFREGSRFLPSFAFDSREAWHSHIGFFEPTKHGSRHLLNANADITLDGWPGEIIRGPSARLLILATEQFDLPGYPPLVIEKENFMGQIQDSLERIHALEKSVLRATLSDEYLALIGDLDRAK